MAQDADVKKELVPTGKLRVAVAYGPSASALYTLRHPVLLQYKGVTIDLGKGLADKLGVPVEYVGYLASGEIIRDVDANKWDVTFMPVDEARKKIVDFGAPYHVLQSTFLVTNASGIKTLDGVNKKGIRVVGVENTATYRAAHAFAPQAEFITVPGVDAGVDLLKAGKADAIALSRESLTGLVNKIPDSVILDGGFLNSTTAVAVPKGRAAALAYVTAYVEEAKASGMVRKSFDAMGLTGSTVAPAGMKP